MNLIFAIVGSLLGLFAAGAALWTAWSLYERSKAEEKRLGRKVDPLDAAGPVLNRWTWLDAALVVLFGCGFLLLLADLFAVLRDREAFPPYHAAYLLCGALFTFLAMLFLSLRLLVAIRSLQVGRMGTVPPEHHHKPDHTHHAE